MKHSRPQKIASTIGLTILITFVILLLAFVPSDVGKALLFAWFIAVNVLLHPKFRRWLIGKLKEIDDEDMEEVSEKDRLDLECEQG